VSSDYSYAYSRSYVRALAAADGYDRSERGTWAPLSSKCDLSSNDDSDQIALAAAFKFLDDALNQAELLAST
jgi:hypothetical protein